MDDFQKHLKESLKDPEFKKEWEASELEYQIRCMLIDARNEENLTQKELSLKSGIRQSNISRIENGNEIPSLNTLQTLAKALGKTLKITML